MTNHYGIDTSILVRLITGDPTEEFDRVVRLLKKLIKDEPNAEIQASNQVIGEAYIALQHHYQVAKSDARKALLTVLDSGLISPLNAEVFEILKQEGGCGLMDRLIADDYEARGMVTLTLDLRMAKLSGARRL